MANIKQISEDGQLQVELEKAEAKLVVVDFFATWCGPCQRIAPKFGEFCLTYPNAVFVKVDVDICPQTAGQYNVNAMPTFLFFKQKTKIDELKGADPNVLEEKIKKWYIAGDAEDSGVKGHQDLSSFINKSGCECLNESDENTFANALSPKGGFLESDCDEQLIMSAEFTQTVRLHSLKIVAPEDKGPKNMKVFINLPNSLDFDKAESMDCVQKFVLTPDDMRDGALINLRYVKFQNVNSITIFVKDNQNDEEVTQIDYLGFIGTPVLKTNMSEFKRVAGKKGESH